MLCFWSSKFHFWRKSRTKASFLSFRASFLKEVSRKCLVLSFKVSFLKEVPQKSFVFELQSFTFEGSLSLAEMLRFWCSKLRFWRKSRTKASFLSFKASILKEVSQKSFVLELQSFNFEGSLPEKLWISNRLTAKSLESQINWQPTHLSLKPIDNQSAWISNQLTTTSLEVQFNRQPKSFEAHINWQPNHLKLKSIDNQLTWTSNQLTTNSFESQIIWQPNHLTLNSFESDINWLSNHLNSTHTLSIGSLSLETSATASCGRYVMFIYCYILLYTVIYCYILLYTVIYCHILLYTVIYCYILLYTVIYCYILLYIAVATTIHIPTAVPPNPAYQILHVIPEVGTPHLSVIASVHHFGWGEIGGVRCSDPKSIVPASAWFLIVAACCTPAKQLPGSLRFEPNLRLWIMYCTEDRFLKVHLHHFLLQRSISNHFDHFERSGSKVLL